MISESDSRIFMLLVKILVSASQSQTTNYLFLTRHLHWCATLPRGEICRTRGRDANLFHSSSLKRPKCNAATKHVAFWSYRCDAHFASTWKKSSLIAVAIDVAAHNWAKCVTFSFSVGCWKSFRKLVIEVGADGAGWERVDSQKGRVQQLNILNITDFLFLF